MAGSHTHRHSDAQCWVPKQEVREVSKQGTELIIGAYGGLSIMRNCNDLKEEWVEGMCHQLEICAISAV